MRESFLTLTQNQHSSKKGLEKWLHTNDKRNFVWHKWSYAKVKEELGKIFATVSETKVLHL